MESFFEKCLAEQNVRLEIAEYDLQILRKTPPALLVANHLFNRLDELILLRLLSEIVENQRVINPYFQSLGKKIKPFVLSPKGKSSGQHLFKLKLAAPIFDSISKGEGLGLALDFSPVPLGSWPLDNLERGFLRKSILKEIRRAAVPIVPVHLSTDRPTEVFLKGFLPPNFPKTSEPILINVRIGRPILPAEQAVFSKNKDWAAFLKAKIFALGSPVEVKSWFFQKEKPKTPKPIAEPTDPALVEADIAALPFGNLIAKRADFEVYVAPNSLIPNALREIGRLRELTFRAVGEGVGQALDLDEYDLYYKQLIIWDKSAKRIVGGYRLGEGDFIFKNHRVEGFYTNTVFKFKSGFYPILQRGVELGRSYIVPDYQKHRLSLFMLWKGILHFLLQNPQYQYLYGPVSISKFYTDISKSLIVEFIQKYFFNEELAKEVKPRKAFRFSSQTVDTELLAENLNGNFEALENFVEDIEPEHIKSPVLLKQYIKQNARFVSFNVDPNFSDCLDGLMVLDLKNLPMSTIEALQQEK